jgi:hypothetical protein
MGKNPQCITVDTLAVFSHLENRISTQPPLSRYGQVLPAFPREASFCSSSQELDESVIPSITLYLLVRT